VKAKILTRCRLQNGVRYCAEFITLFFRIGKLKDKEHYQINFTIEYKIQEK
jgi:hypothetical protein